MKVQPETVKTDTMTSGKACVLILFADVGYGHRSASNAIVHALEERFSVDLDVILANPFDEPSVPARFRLAQADHARLVRELPQIYSLGLRATDSDLTKGIGSVAGRLILSDAVRDLVDRHEPTVVIVMHPIITEPLLSYRRSNDGAFQIITVITDLARPHRLWFDAEIDLFLLPNRSTVGLAIDRGIPTERLLVTGIPIHPYYVKPSAPQEDLRRELELAKDLFTILAVGSQRVANLDAYLTSLNESGLPIQIIAVAGGEHSLYETLQGMTWKVPVALFNHVDTMPDLMYAADCIVTKAGGLIVAESLGCGLPMLITSCNPVHEQGNAEYVVLQGAGEMVEAPEDIVPVLNRWLESDRELFTYRAANAKRLGRACAAYDVAEIVSLLVEGHAPSSEAFTGFRQMD